MFCLLGRLGSSLFSPLTSPHAASGFRLGEHGSGQWPHQISFIVCQLNLGKIAARFNCSERHNLAVKSVIQSFGSTRERGLLRRRSGAIKQLSSHPWRPYLERLEFRVSLLPCYLGRERSTQCGQLCGSWVGISLRNGWFRVKPAHVHTDCLLNHSHPNVTQSLIATVLILFSPRVSRTRTDYRRMPVGKEKDGKWSVRPPSKSRHPLSPLPPPGQQSSETPLAWVTL